MQVYLTVDTGMESGELSIRAYVARKANIGDRTLAMKFQEVEVEVQTAEMESVGGELDAVDQHCLNKRLS